MYRLIDPYIFDLYPIFQMLQSMSVVLMKRSTSLYYGSCLSKEDQLSMFTCPKIV